MSLQNDEIEKLIYPILLIKSEKMITQIEKNLKISFNEVKKELAQIKVQIFNLSERYEKLAELNSKSKKNNKKK